MDKGTYHGLLTLVALIGFVAITLWAWSARRRADFDHGSSALDLVNATTGLTEPTDDVFDASPATLRIQLRNARNDHFEVNLFSLTGLTEVKEGWTT